MILVIGLPPDRLQTTFSIGNPAIVSAPSTARAIEFAISNDINGVWNLTNGEEISKYNMLTIFNQLHSSHNQKVIIPVDSKVSNKSLKSERSEIDYKVPTYLKMFEEMGKDIFSNKTDYSHYKGLK